MSKKILPLAALALSFLVAPTQAITIVDSCKISDVSTSQACIGRVVSPKNDKAKILNDEVFFDVINWELIQKTDKSQSTPFDLTITGDDTSSGTWNILSFNDATAVTLVVKAANNWAAYLLDLTEGLSGTWSTAALINGGGNQPALSHISLYISTAAIPPGGTNTPSVVPVPAALPLFGTGLAIMGFIGWRRKRNAVG